MKPGLLSEIEKIRLIDTHEHVRVGLRLRDRGREIGLFDIFATNQYLRAELISAGMPPENWEKAGGDPDRDHRLLSLYLAAVSSTSYFASLRAGLERIYGFRGDLSRKTDWLRLDRRVRNAYRDRSWEESVLREQAGVEKLFYCYGWNYRPCRWFVPVLRMDNFFDLTDKNWPRAWEQDHLLNLAEKGIAGETFAGLPDGLEKIFRWAKEKKTAAVKMASAYTRSLEFKPAPLSAARKIFDRRGRGVTPAAARAFEDATMPFLLNACIRHRLPVQFHTGLPGGNASRLALAGSNPALLQNLIFAFPEARFVLFHGGYPFLGESLNLGKKFPNVYLDLCWLPLLSYSTARRFLAEALEAVPANKIMWGGDCHNVESITGAACFFRALLAEVLGEKVEKKEIGRTRALAIARGILSENARSLYRL